MLLCGSYSLGDGPLWTLVFFCCGAFRRIYSLGDSGYFPSVMAWSLARGGGEQFREDKHSRMSVLRAQVAGGQEKEQERKECGARLLGKELN